MTQNIVIAIVLSLALGYLLLKRLDSGGSSDARRLVAEGARLVDVRTAEEFAETEVEARLEYSGAPDTPRSTTSGA